MFRVSLPHPGFLGENLPEVRTAAKLFCQRGPVLGYCHRATVDVFLKARVSRGRRQLGSVRFMIELAIAPLAAASRSVLASKAPRGRPGWRPGRVVFALVYLFSHLWHLFGKHL